MPALGVKHGDSWVTTLTPKVKDAGTWKTPVAVFAKSGGSWVQCWPTGFLGSGVVTTWRSDLDRPTSMAINTATGDVFFSKAGANTITRIDSGGTLHTYTDTGSAQVEQMVLHNDGHIYFNSNNTRIRRLNTSTWAFSAIAGGTSTGMVDATGATARFGNLAGKSLVSQADGFIYVADAVNNRVRKVSTAGVVTTLYSTGVTAIRTMAFNAAGNLVWANATNQMYIRDAGTGTSTLLAGQTTAGDTDGTGSAARFRSIADIIIEPTTGDIFVSEINGNRLRKVTPAGVVTLFAGSPTALTGFADGTGSAASFNFNGTAWAGCSLALAGGYIFVTDPGNNMIRRIA